MRSRDSVKIITLSRKLTQKNVQSVRALQESNGCHQKSEPSLQEGNTYICLPMYCEVNFTWPSESENLTNGEERVETAISPTKVRGTTPG